MWASAQWDSAHTSERWKANSRSYCGRDVVVEVLRVVGDVELRPDEHEAVHAHVHVLDVFDVAVEHVRAGVARPVHVPEHRAGRHRHRTGGLTVEERDHVAEPVPVQRVSIEEVGPHGEAEVGDVDHELVVGVVVELVHPEQRGAVLGVFLLGEPIGLVEFGDVAKSEDVRRQIGALVGRHGVGMERRDRRRLGQPDPAVGTTQEHVAVGLDRRHVVLGRHRPDENGWSSLMLELAATATTAAPPAYRKSWRRPKPTCSMGALIVVSPSSLPWVPAFVSAVRSLRMRITAASRRRSCRYGHCRLWCSSCRRTRCRSGHRHCVHVPVSAVPIGALFR